MSVKRTERLGARGVARGGARRVAIGLVWGLVWGAVPLGGCVVRGGPGGPGARVVRPGEPGGPFAPASLSVVPLTGLGLDAEGRAVLRVHIELRDAWGDVVKGAGRLEVSVFAADGAGEEGGASGGRVVYDVDLRDLGLNARLYDPVTRTYVVPLREGLPGWAVEIARGGSGVAGGGPGGGAGGGAGAVVSVRMFLEDGRGETVELRDRRAVRGPGAGGREPT